MGSLRVSKGEAYDTLAPSPNVNERRICTTTIYYGLRPLYACWKHITAISFKAKCTTRRQEGGQKEGDIRWCKALRDQCGHKWDSGSDQSVRWRQALRYTSHGKRGISGMRKCREIQGSRAQGRQRVTQAVPRVREGKQAAERLKS